MTKVLIKKTIEIFLLFFLFLGIHFLDKYIMVYHHEGTHEAICLLEGGKITDKQISLFDESYVTCSLATENTRKGYILTDVVGYHLMGFVNVLEVLLFVYLIIKYNH